MDVGIQLTEQVILCSVKNNCKYSCNRYHHKQVRICPLCDKPLSVRKVDQRILKSISQSHPDFTCCFSDQEFENNQDMTEITNKYQLEEFKLIGPFDTSIGMFYNSSFRKGIQEIRD